eukprot:Gb_07381 [translate_table: standard]
MAAIQANTTSSFLSQISETGRSVYAQRRPWSELYGTNAFGKPESFGDAVARIRRHLIYFRVNYAIIILTIVCLALLRQPFSLITVLGLLIAWCLLYFFRSEPLVLMNRSFGDGTVLTGLTIVTVVALLLTGVTSAIITALVIGSVIVLVHGAFRVSDDLFVDEQEAAAGGLLSARYSNVITSTNRV